MCGWQHCVGQCRSRALTFTKLSLEDFRSVGGRDQGFMSKIRIVNWKLHLFSKELTLGARDSAAARWLWLGPGLHSIRSLRQ